MAKHATFTEQTNTRLTPDMLARLVAISFYQGQRGDYAPVIRGLLLAGIARFEAGLDERGHRRYEEILSNVRESESLRASNPTPG